MTILVLTCQKCGGNMPPIDTDTEEGKLLLTKGAALQHEVCPTDAQVATTARGRRYEARVQLVEIVAKPHDWDMPHDMRDLSRPGCPPNCPATADPDIEELANFIVQEEGPNLATAMRPLAQKLGEQWVRVEQHANLIDIPDVREL